MRVETLDHKRIKKMSETKLRHLLQLLNIRLINHEKQTANYPTNRQIFRDQMTNHIKGQMDFVNKEIKSRENDSQ